jgi:hypothetical protein
VGRLPTDIALSNGSVAENQPVDTVVGVLSTTDPNVGDTFTYTLVGGDTAMFSLKRRQPPDGSIVRLRGL